MFLDGSTGWSGSDCRYVSAIVPQPLQEFIASGVSPSIEKTLDGGATWTYEHIPASTILPDNLRYEAPPGMTEAVGVKCGAERIQRISAQAFLSIEGCSQGYAIESAFRYGFLTPDGGATWLNWLASGDEFFVTSSRGWRTLPSESGGLSKLQRSDDGGRTWTTIRSVAWEDVTFDFIDELTGWVVGTVAGQRGLAYTEDGGDTWVVLRPVAAP